MAGLGDGLDADARMTRTMLAELPSALVAYSCDKHFGLSRDRVGALWVRVPLAEQTATVRGNLLQLASALWAMPPDHGAAVVQCILEDDDLRQQWHGELDGMRARINEMRTLLAAAHPRMRNIASQRGMFAMLPIDPKQAMALREHDAIYLTTSGRINIAGLTAESTSRLVARLAPYL